MTGTNTVLLLGQVRIVIQLMVGVLLIQSHREDHELLLETDGQQVNTSGQQFHLRRPKHPKVISLFASLDLGANHA